MSHFSCLIISKSYSDVETLLEPYLELECSMTSEEIKNDPRATFEESLSTEELIKDFNESINNHPDIYYENIEEFAKDYHGYYKKENEEVWGRYTNKNSKWDWYEIGGRWTGFFKVKNNIKYPDDIGIGRPGLMTTPAEEGYVDTIRLCDIDFEGMKQDSIKRSEKNWSEFKKKLKNGEQHLNYFYGVEPNETKKSYIDRHSGFSTFAVIKDGQWYEKGEMGWFGISINEKEDWATQFDELIKSLPEDSQLTIVDCHI